MNDILKSYTQKEIEELALKQLETENVVTQEILKIERIDKEYKKHNRNAVLNALANGSMIAVFIGIILNSNSNIANFGTDDILNIFNDLSDKLSILPKSEILIGVYSKMFNCLNLIIEKIGLIGIILANKSIKFVIKSVGDIRKSQQLKSELLYLKKQLKEKEFTK